MQKADYLLRLMKQRTDALIASDGKLQEFLMWVNEKSIWVNVPYKPAAIRAFYFYLFLALAHPLILERTFARAFYRANALNLLLKFNLASALASNLESNHALKLDRALASTLDLALNRTRARTLDGSQTLDHAVIDTLSSAIVRTLDPDPERSLQQLKDQLPDPDNWKRFDEWWQANGHAWTKQLRAVMIVYRNIGHDWQFNEQQKELLEQYYEANKLLVDCLNSASSMTPAVRSQIEDTLLLPIAEIEKRDASQDK
jgi:predicted NACHT family NTPase